MELPTFVHRALQQYNSRTASSDVADRYKSLEAAWSSAIKYVGSVAASVASVHCSRREPEIADAILSTSSLGGWVRAMDLLCASCRDLPCHVAEYLAAFNDYKKHPEKDVLDEIATTLSEALRPLQQRGYSMIPPKSPSLLRVLEQAVAIRNKHAHGYLDPRVLNELEGPLHRALKSTLLLIPFSAATMMAPFGRGTCRLTGSPPQKVSATPRRDELWFEGEPLGADPVSVGPFAVFHGDSERVFFLNQAGGSGPTEYIDHATGSIKYWDLPARCMKGNPRSRPARRPEPAEVAEADRWLRESDLEWREVELTKESLRDVKGESGVYCFVNHLGLGAAAVGAAILYVGSSRSDMAGRLREYLRHRERYDSRREEIAQMFKAYPRIRLLFAPTTAEDAMELEQAIYAASQPAYNLRAPRAAAAGQQRPAEPDPAGHRSSHS